MLAAPHRFEVHGGLMQAIGELGVEKRVLMTNTHQASGAEFLEFMRIGHVFDEICCGAGKPSGAGRLFGFLAAAGIPSG